MHIQILGSGCAKCALLELHAREAVAELGLDATVEKVADIGAIVAMGVMSTPALVVDGKVRSTGRALSRDQVKAYLSGSSFVPK